MELSNGEKLILFMVSEIHGKLGVDSAIDPEFVKKAISADHVWGLRWKYPWIFCDPAAKNPAVVDEVVSILTMWHLLELAYKYLPPEDKALLDDELPGGKPLQFKGFDGNVEAEHFSAAKFLIDDMGEFPDYKGRYLNTHFPVIDSYRQMRPVYERLRESLHGRAFNASELLKILKARRAEH